MLALVFLRWFGGGFRGLCFVELFSMVVCLAGVVLWAGGWFGLVRVMRVFRGLNCGLRAYGAYKRRFCSRMSESAYKSTPYSRCNFVTGPTASGPCGLCRVRGIFERFLRDRKRARIPECPILTGE